MKKRLSVIITTRNRLPLCKRAIDSVLKSPQFLSDSELTVIDDCSAPFTVRALLLYCRHHNVRFKTTSEQSGLAFARNLGVRLSNASWFTFLDDDDFWPSGYYEQLTKTLKESGPGYSGILFFPSSSNNKDKRKQTECSIHSLFLQGITPPVASQIYSQTILSHVKGYNTRVYTGVDHDLWVRILDFDPSSMFAFRYGLIPIINNSFSTDRMTTDESHRIHNLSSSLQIWRPILESKLSPRFFQRFVSNYYTHVYLKLFLSDIANHSYTKIAKKLFKPITYKGIYLYFVRKHFFGLNTFFPFKQYQ